MNIKYLHMYSSHILIVAITLVTVLHFYLFNFLDRFFLFIITAPYMIVLVVILRLRKKYASIQFISEYRNIYILEKIIASLIFAGMLGYLNGLRYEFSLLFSTQWFKMFKRLRTLAILDSFNQYNVYTVSYNWISQLEHFLSKDTASLIVALTTGNKDFIHLALKDLVRRNGISHLLALSGFHLSIVIIGLQSVEKCIKKITGYSFHVYIINFLILLVVWLYCIWIGFIPSLYRAALMFSCSIFMKHVLGQKKFLTIWMSTLLILMILYPPIMYEHGFILSMLALLGVVGGAHVASIRKIKYIPSIIIVPLYIGLGATICTAWYSMLVFGATYPIGIVVSILLTPFVTVFMVLGMMFLCISYIHWGGIGNEVMHGFAYILDMSMYAMRRILIFFSDSITLDSWSDLWIFYMSVLLYIVICAFKKLLYSLREKQK